MAINTFEKSFDKIESKYSSHNSRDSLPPNKTLNLSIFTDDSLSSDSRSSKAKRRKYAVSPYLANDNVNLRSRVEERKYMQKRATNIVSSFPLAVNIYKANSDEFKSQKKSLKKVKKSVLTLPNVPVSTPQTCTVSDMNDSEDMNTRDGNKKLRTKKRFQAQKGKTRNRDKGYEFYDRDARFCSQMNLDLNYSSSDIMKFTGDGRRVSNKYRSQNNVKTENDFNAHDVWAVLRNINRFQFRPSPPMSDEDSVKTPVKKKIRNKRRTNFNERRIIETRRTEEFAYISSFDFESKSPPSFSQCSSFDRITVIDKQEEISEVCHELEKSPYKRNNLKGKTRRHFLRNQNKNNMKNNDKVITSKEINNQSRRLHENQNNKTTTDNFRPQNNLIGTTNNQISEVLHHEVADPPKKEDLKQENKESNDTASTKRKSNSVATLSHSQCGSFNADKINGEVNKDDMKSSIVPSFESIQNMKGITKVVLSKGLNDSVEPKQIEIQTRKQRLLTRMPSTAIMPRLTTTEIKRRLANMKFPIIILGKDQLGGSSIRVTKYEEHPQFAGLDQHIWPFMQDWYESNLTKQERISEKKGKLIERVEEPKVLTKNKVNVPKDRKANLRNTKNEMTVSKKDPMKSSNFSKTEQVTNRNKFWKKLVPLDELNQNKQLQPKISKPVQHLQDTMLRFLYKKTSIKSLDEQLKSSGNNGFKDMPIPGFETKSHENNQKEDASTETSEIPERDISMQSKTSRFPETSKLSTMTKPSWAKGKWTSEFIENVIKKIRKGIYYTQENIHRNQTLPLSSRDVSIQTLLSRKDIIEKQELLNVNKEISVVKDNFSNLDVLSEHTNIVLPGFEKSPPALEIKTLNMKEISICHCTTNVMLQFDVADLLDAKYRNKLLKSSCFIPLAMNESHTKVFKCKKTILNAVLPAELCSIIPKVLAMIIDSAKQPSLPAIKPYHKDTNLYTISELLRNDIPDIPKCGLPTGIGSSPDFKKQFYGSYTSKIYAKEASNVNKLQTNVGHIDNRNFLPMIHCIQLLLPFKVNPLNYIRSKPDRNNSVCTALQLYKAPAKACDIVENKINLTAGKCTINNLLKQMWNQDIIVRFKISMPLSFPDRNDKIINIQIKSNIIGRNNNIFTSPNNLEMNSLYNGLNLNKIDNQANILTESSLKMIENKVNPIEQKVEKKYTHPYWSCVKAKKSFVKLYKKCKSTSNISGERCNTSLDKITNLDEFFQALGSGKMMSSVFDGSIGKKILSSVSEMKNWITDISQRQAMLILLLINKKDTPNLVRFRPLLLQGIAVNRITRASELDMEIEVIEKEHFNSFSQFEEIPYKQETTVNKDNLLEELFWIAKTTASDYQKPFNESSENLLKSLLEKRKKLNPSYLRVMARYVGLGLLKAPRKRL